MAERKLFGHDRNIDNEPLKIVIIISLHFQSSFKKRGLTYTETSRYSIRFLAYNQQSAEER